MVGVWLSDYSLHVVCDCVFGFQLWDHRQLRQRQIEQLEQETKQKKEFEVMERTAKLHAEIAERIKTEHALRQTLDELIQAAKLAVLGQMSASISHELNNPLAAISSFADNGRRFLPTNKPERAEENLAFFRTDGAHGENR